MLATKGLRKSKGSTSNGHQDRSVLSLLELKILASSSLVPPRLFLSQGLLRPQPMIVLKYVSSSLLLLWPEGLSIRVPVDRPCQLTCTFLLQLLPIPDSLPISPDDGQHADIYKLRIRVRGNLEWAPPRPQIIFNVHPAPT